MNSLAFSFIFTDCKCNEKMSSLQTNSIDDYNRSDNAVIFTNEYY